MNTTISSFKESMESLRKTVTRKDGVVEFWSAREIQTHLGYDSWVNFLAVIGKARENCDRVGQRVGNHFADVSKMVSIGSGAEREQKDFILSRTACYLIALNGDASKEEIAWAKAYFVVQTRLQEVEQSAVESPEERQRLREKLKQANKLLGSAAKSAGVEKFAYFHDAGISGLYGMKMSDLKAHKGVNPKDDYWERVCCLELSANEFRAQLARETIAQRKAAGTCMNQVAAETVHRRIGESVRATVKRETGKNLEDLPAEPPIKVLLKARKKVKASSVSISTTLPPPPSQQFPSASQVSDSQLGSSPL